MTLVPNPGHYLLKLKPVLTPKSQTRGPYFQARIDDGPIPGLLPDSGAQHIVLGRRAAAKTGRKWGANFELAGVGTAAPAACKDFRCRPASASAAAIG